MLVFKKTKEKRDEKHNKIVHLKNMLPLINVYLINLTLNIHCIY